MKTKIFIFMLVLFLWIFSQLPHAEATHKVVFITTVLGSTYIVPDNWSASSTVEVIGYGTVGKNASPGAGAGGGGGGAYSKSSDLFLRPGDSITINVGELGGVEDTYFRKGSTCSITVCVLAKGGTGADLTTGGAGGLASDGVGEVKYSGGTGGNGNGTADSGGGGGGAGGPYGNGANGGPGDTDNTTDGVGGGGGGGGGGTAGGSGIVSDTVGAAGGNNYLGSGGGTGSGAAGSNGGGGSGGDDTQNGGAAGNGIERQSSTGVIAGSGGGGGGAGDAADGGAGGLYGGAGGGGEGFGGADSQGIVIITYTPVTLSQVAYRWFQNTNTANVGLAAPINTPIIMASTSVPFRLRMLLHVNQARLLQSGTTTKLQFAEKSGTCDTEFSGESYSDVSSTTGRIRFFNNPGVADGATLTPNVQDPVHAATSTTHTVFNQVYSEGAFNLLTNSVSTTTEGSDMLFDFSLINATSPPRSSYCFRIIGFNAETLSSYSVIPEITTGSIANVKLRDVRLRDVRLR